MEGFVPVADDLRAPSKSWEVDGLDASMRRLILFFSFFDDKGNPQPLPFECAQALAGAISGRVSKDVVNTVDQFLREALKNPREHLSIMRMEQDVEKFIKDPGQQQMEFQPLPTSYFRLAAHCVAQHYSLQSMVLLDNSLPDGSGPKILVNMPQGDTGVVKVAIKCYKITNLAN
uniref:R3h domain containing protein n=1 Tax=Solanum tuberosum TaxID=4113 RepID=M1D9F8_SOLTU